MSKSEASDGSGAGEMGGTRAVVRGRRRASRRVNAGA